MQTTANADCPFCGAPNEVSVEALETNSVFVSDCENCCRPFEVRAHCEDGEILTLEVRPG